jgi:TolB-like protein/Flp pilus assembly protein TadD
VGDSLLDAAARIADGEVIEWDSVTATLSTDHDIEIAEQLALVQQIAVGHRQLHQLLPAAADTPPHLMPDRARWGHLDLLNVVGRGSYGMVYRAWDTRLERLVALKLYHGASDPGAVMQEGRMLARVRHENVVTVYGADVIDGVAGIWMELVHGKTLDSIVKSSGSLTAREAASVGADIALALGAVHSAALLHCDVKAQNVVRENSGRVVLMDLGAGRLAPEARDLDQPVSDLAGTPRYMAPELFARGATATKATDIYSLGVLIYFLVTGDYPVDGKTFGELKRSHDAKRFRPLADVKPDLSKPFLEIVERSIDREPARRPLSAEDVHSVLAAVAAEEPAPARLSPSPWWIAGAVTLVVLAVALIGSPWRAPVTIDAPTPSIAVLPIRNLTGDPAKQYLADGLTEVLGAHLARVPGLQVASSATMATLGGATGDERAVAERLGVRLLLAGAVIQADQRIILSIKLNNPREGTTIWGAELERQPANILGARTEIASLVAARLSLVAPPRAGTQRELKAEAQDLFLRGLVELTSNSVTRLPQAEQLLMRAVALEPQWADPLAHLSFAQQRNLEAGDPAKRGERAAVAKANALHAIQLDPAVPMSYTALAAVQAYHDWDLAGAEATLRQGLGVVPDEPLAHTRLALLLAATGRLQEAVAEAERARALEPLVADRHATLGIVRYYARDYDGALADMQRALSVSPGYRPAIFGTGRILMAAGRHDDAIRELLRVTDATGIAENPGWLAHLGMAYALAGRPVDVDRVLEQLRMQQSQGRYISIDNYAYIAANQGRMDDAFSLLNEAVTRRMTSVLWLAVDPRADALRPDPRFDRLVQAMGVTGR